MGDKDARRNRDHPRWSVKLTARGSGGRAVAMLSREYRKMWGANLCGRVTGWSILVMEPVNPVPDRGCEPFRVYRRLVSVSLAVTGVENRIRTALAGSGYARAHPSVIDALRLRRPTLVRPPRFRPRSSALDCSRIRLDDGICEWILPLDARKHPRVSRRHMPRCAGHLEGPAARALSVCSPSRRRVRAGAGVPRNVCTSRHEKRCANRPHMDWRLPALPGRAPVRAGDAAH